MFQPQPTPYASFAYGEFPNFTFHSAPIAGLQHGSQSDRAPEPPTFLYNTNSQPTSFQPVSAAPAPSPLALAPAASAAPSISAASAPLSSLAPSHASTGGPQLAQHLQSLGSTASVAAVLAPRVTTASASSPVLAPGPLELSSHLQHRPHPRPRTHMRRQQQPQRHQQSRHALRSQVKMEGDLQQLSEIAAQEVAARDYKAQPQGPLVGDKTPSEAITDEYAKADPVYVQKTIALPQTYSHYRPIRGDGNCGWRAIAFAYFEYLIDTGDRDLVEAELARLTSTTNFLVQNGYEMALFEDMVQETLDLTRDLANNIDNPTAAMAALMARFGDESLDNAIIYHMRILAAACMKSDPTPYEHFILGEGGIQEFLHGTIEVPNREIDQIGINLLVKMLLEPAGLDLEIAYLDRTPGSEVNTYRIPDSSDSQISTTLCLLFRPDHYDIVYRRPSPPPLPPPPPAPAPSSIQVHRADSLREHVQIVATPGGMPNLDPTGMTTLETLVTGYGCVHGLSLGPLSQASPLSETYSPVSQPVWPPIVPTFTDPLGHSPLPRRLSPTQAQPQPLMEADLDRQVRFSKYNYPELVEDPGYPEPTFQTMAFKNSQYNKAHYNNPNFQPEEYNPNEDPCERNGYKRKGQL